MSRYALCYDIAAAHLCFVLAWMEPTLEHAMGVRAKVATGACPVLQRQSYALGLVLRFMCAENRNEDC